MTEFLKEDEVKSKLNLWQVVKSLWPFSKKYPVMLGASIFFLLLHIVAARMIPWTIGKAVDDGVVAKNTEVLFLMAWIYLGVETTHAFTQYVYRYLFQRFGNRVLADLRLALVQHTQSLPLEYFHRNPVGRIVTRLTNDPENMADLFSESLVSVCVNVIVVIAIIVSMLLISWKLTLATLVLAPLFLIAAYQVTQKMRVHLRQSKKQLSTMNSFASESLQGNKILQILNATSSNNQKFSKLSDDYKDIVLASIRSSALLQPIMNLMTAITVASALAGGSYLSLNEGLALGAFVAFLLHSQDIVHPIREVLERYQQFQNSLTSAERVFHVFDETPEALTVGAARSNTSRSDASRLDASRLEASGSNVSLMSLVQIPERRPETERLSAGELRIQNLWFRYSESTPWVLEDLSIHVPAGKRAALTGRTGAGKSTLISLLQRFYEPPPGSILLDGHDVLSLLKSDLRRFLGVIQQDPVIFRGTIGENLSLLDPKITEAKMKTALAEIGALDYLKKNGRDLSTQVEERGANLSLGERQLICFARILVFDPPFLILDEATANIDSETEALIQKAVERITTGRTSLVIAHRLSTLKSCDLFFELENGRASGK